MKLFQLLEAATEAERREWLRYQDELEELLGDDWEVRFNYDGIFKFKTPGKIEIEEFEFDYLKEIEELTLIEQIKSEFTGIHSVEIVSKYISGFDIDIVFDDSQSLVLFLHQYYLGTDHMQKVPSMISLKKLNLEFDINEILKNAILL